MTEEEEFEFRLRLEQEKGAPAKPAPPKPSFMGMLKDEAMTSVPGGVLRGFKDIVDTGADFLSRTASPQENARIKAMNEAGKAEFAAAQERTGNVVAPAVGRIGGNVLATLPVGGVLANAVSKIPGAASRVPGFIDALRTSGMSAGGKTGFASLPARMAGGAVTGGATAAAIDPDDAALGAGVGALFPAGVMLASRAGQAVGPALFKKSAERAAAAKVEQALGDKSPQAVWDMQVYPAKAPQGARGIPLSASAITGDTALAQLEQGSRLRSAPVWNEFDQRQGKAVFDNVIKATSEADELAARAAQRRHNWSDNWAKASAAQKPRIWQQRMGRLGTDIEQAMASPEASNPAVRNLLQAVRDEVVRVGPSFSPGHLQQLRANLNGKINPMSPDVFKSAPRDTPAIKSLMAEMDDILNAATGGKWDGVRKGYAADSTKVHQSKAAQKVRNAFVDAETGRIQGVSLDPSGDVAKITEAGLGRAMNAARLPDKTLALSPQANDSMEAILGALRRQNIVQGLKRSATAGGGSDTVSNAIASGIGGAPSWAVQALNLGRRAVQGKTDDQLARLLSDPDSLAAALARFSQPSQPGPLALSVSRSLPILTGQGEGP